MSKILYTNRPARTGVFARFGYIHPICAPLPEPVDDHDVFQRLATAGDALLVITSPFCGACRAMLRALERLPPGTVDRTFIADAGDSSGLVADLEVFHLPALFLFRDGDFHRPIEAPPQVSALVQALAEARAAPPVEAP